MIKIKKFISVLLVVLLLLSLFAGCSTKNKHKNKNYTFEDGVTLTGLHYVAVQLRDYGGFIIEVDADSAPKTATHFLKAVNQGAYDGTMISIGLEDVVIGGGYNEDYKETVEGEFSLNGYENPIKAEPGVIYLSHSTDYNGASTQFFVQLDDDESYTDSYAAFGHIADCFSTLTAIASSSICNSSYGTIPTSFQPVITYMEILDDYTPAK